MPIIHRVSKKLVPFSISASKNSSVIVANFDRSDGHKIAAYGTTTAYNKPNQIDFTNSYKSQWCPSFVCFCSDSNAMAFPDHFRMLPRNNSWTPSFDACLSCPETKTKLWQAARLRQRWRLRTPRRMCSLLPSR